MTTLPPEIAALRERVARRCVCADGVSMDADLDKLCELAADANYWRASHDHLSATLKASEPFTADCKALQECKEARPGETWRLLALRLNREGERLAAENAKLREAAQAVLACWRRKGPFAPVWEMSALAIALGEPLPAHETAEHHAPAPQQPPAQEPPAPPVQGAPSDEEIEAWRASAMADPCRPPGYDRHRDASYPAGFWLSASEVDEAIALMRRARTAPAHEPERVPAWREKLRLYHVKDGDCPMFVVARDWSEALRMWEAKMREHGDVPADEEIEGPQGIDFVADERELLLPAIEALAEAVEGRR